MAVFRTASQTIAEMREFAGFCPHEQFHIERSLEIVRGPRPFLAAREAPAAGALPSRCRRHAAAQKELIATTARVAADQPLEEAGEFLLALMLVTRYEIAGGMIESFAAYRFLYERLLGARVRPFLPAAFCAAAALPEVEPARRARLIASVGAAVLATPGWSMREPIFFPSRLAEEPLDDQYSASSLAP